MGKHIKSKWLHICILTVILFVYQTFVGEISWKIASLFDCFAIDKDGIFMSVSVHHIFMALVTLGILCAIQKKINLDFKLKPKKDKRGITYTALFCAAILVYYIVWYVVFGIVLDAIAGYDYELTAVNILGTLGFQLLLSGTAEELVFRALPIGCLRAVCGKNSKFADVAVLLLSSVLFTIAHINFTLPLSGQWYSLIYVFVGGLIYGVAYLKSSSIIYPMMMHGVSNFISVGGCYLYMVLFRT